MYDLIWLVIAYAILGGGIKYIDQAYDENFFNKRFAILTAIGCGLLMGFLIATDPTSAIIFAAILFGVGLSRKIDSPAFYVGASLVIVSLLYLLFLAQTNLSWIPLVVLGFSALIDELGNDLADTRRVRGALHFFFSYRFSMKVAIVALVWFGYLHWYYLAAFLAFDLAYTFVEWYSYKKPFRIAKIAW